MADVREGSLIMDGEESSLIASTQTAVDLAELEMDVTSQETTQGEVGGFCSDHTLPQMVRATTIWQAETNMSGELRQKINIHICMCLLSQSC